MKVKEAIEQARGNDDMWQQVDKALTATEPPPDSFSLEDFMHRRGGITRGVAQGQIRRLRESGVIRSLGRFGNKTYYQLVKT